MISTLFQTLRQQLLIRQSLGRLLARDDTHLLDDIGLTRHDAARLITDPQHTGTMPMLRMVTAGGLRLRAV